MPEARSVRENLLGFLSRDLIGPAGGEFETLEDSPRVRYAAGVLFPQGVLRDESSSIGGIEIEASSQTAAEDQASEEVEYAENEGEQPKHQRDPHPEVVYDDSITLANTYRPSAMALSFTAIPPDGGLIVQVRAATYVTEVTTSEQGRKITVWHRTPLELPALTIPLKHLRSRSHQDWKLTDGLCLRGTFRPKTEGKCLVTVSVFNYTVENQRSAETFFQTSFEVFGVGNSAPFVEYRTLESLQADEEDTALAMLYRRRRVFAVGHGVAADWNEVGDGRADKVSTTFLPTVVVPPVNPVSHDQRYLDMAFLRGDCADPAREIPDALEKLCREYEEWISGCDREAVEMEETYRASAARNISVCRAALSRMRAGIELIRSDEKSREAFMLANRAMLMQQDHARRRRNLKDLWTPLPDWDSGYRSDWNTRQGYWRTFQIAFILMTIPGIVSESAATHLEGSLIPDRELVDLIWFPTGGGKTEAYLGVTAFTIFRYRLDQIGDEGCKILMRYTLRLLTSQQFQRAASLICACELIRRKDPERLGSNEISIGLWVGMSLTPNTEKDALRALALLERKGSEAKNPFQLLTCPWCGTELDNPDRYGYAERQGRLVFQCPSRKGDENCPFGNLAAPLPVTVVDDSIYKMPPTLIIGTVDKFAMLAWRSEAGSLLTKGGGPRLVIQDELHLISGPLGSMVGLYEGVIEYLCSRDGQRPKIIASTATIRRANRQCKALYDRETFQFPPPGLDASDSFFAKEDRASPGRLYTGFLPTAASSPLTAQVRSVVSLQQGLLLVSEGAPDSAIDPYWTLVQYFGSLKELGRAATFLTADIPEFIPVMHRRFGIEGDRRRWMKTSEELTSRKNEDEIPKILKRLEVSYGVGRSWDEQALDTLLATNMISVGVDVDRLGLMMIVTQPKGTAEYIQASSRVGRSTRAPGLVFTLYNAARPRDRSHFEHFRGYHEAYYRFVEPTSVTPYSPPALERALHAILVIAGRHVAKWASPTDFDAEDTTFEEFLDFLRSRVRSIDPDHLPEFEGLLADRLEYWEERSCGSWGSLAGSRDEPGLMRPAGSQKTDADQYSWETPTSMRNVDVECAAVVTPRYTVANA